MACTDCVTGTLHTGTPSGTTDTLFGLPTYIASPAGAPKGTIVIVPDAFGWKFNNNRILADAYARKGGFRVLLPDFLAGSDLDESMLAIMDFLLRKGSWTDVLWKVWYALRVVRYFLPFRIGSRFSVTYPRVVAFMTALREADESARLGAAGFCWGGRHVLVLAHGAERTASGKLLLDAAFAAHPSFLSLPADADGVVLPLSVACAEKDMQLSMAATLAMKETLEKKSKAECELTIYEGATHGFAVRANPTVPRENEQGIEAEDQAISWFTKWFT